MFNRWMGILTTAAMVLANATIVVRDLLPRWVADDAPLTDAVLLAPEEHRYTQVGIYDDADRLIGTSWTRAARSPAGTLITVTTTTLLEPVALPTGSTPRVRIETHLNYRSQQATVDSVSFSMYGLGIPITLDGEAMATGEFACKWNVGDERGYFVLDSKAPAALGDVIRPFDRLPDLYVGQTWRVKLLDPLTHLMPNLPPTGVDLEPMIIRVTGQETILHAAQKVRVFVVEGNGAVAYVAGDGRVLRQEVDVPLLGRLTLVDETYDEAALRAAIRGVHSSE